MITYQTEGVEMPHIKKRETTEWVKAVAQTYGKKVGEIAYIFCSDEKILEVNRQYLQHDYYTDIITFDYTEGNRISGDLFISLDTVRTNAEQFNASYETELHRVIKVRASVKSWSKPRTKPSPCLRTWDDWVAHRRQIPHCAKLSVGAGFACPNTSTDILVNAFGRANPAPTLDICRYSFFNPLAFFAFSKINTLRLCI